MNFEALHLKDALGKLLKYYIAMNTLSVENIPVVSFPFWSLLERLLTGKLLTGKLSTGIFSTDKVL